MCLFYSYSKIRSIELAIKAVEARANGRNIVGQQLSKLLDEYAHHAGCCCLLFGVAAQNLKPVKRLATCKRTHLLPTLLATLGVVIIYS